MRTLFKFIQARNFFTTYAPDVKRYAHKVRGLDSNSKPIDFTEEDKRLIKAGLRKMMQDCIKSIGS